MKNLSNKNQQLVLDARKMFVDANEYDEYELVGYCRMVKAACKKLKEIPYGRIRISNIQNVLKTLDERRYNIIRWRYWEGNVRDIIGESLGVSGERVRQLESKALNCVKFELKRILGDSSIETLNLEIRSYLALKRVGINTIEQLVKLTPEELLGIDRIGSVSFEDIKQKLANYIQCVDSEDKKLSDDKPIDVFRFSVRVENALKKAGIMSIKQLFSMSDEELYKIKGIGINGLEQIINIRPKATLETDGQKIDVLGFSVRVKNALKREGVLSVEQFLLLPTEELYIIRGIGKKGFNEVMRKRQELFG